MRITVLLTFIFICLCSVCHTAANAAGVITITNDTVVNSDVNLYAKRIDVTKSVWITNMGVIDSSFYIADNVNLYIQNSGIINGEFYLGDGATITQVISSRDDITYIDTDAPCDILIYNATLTLGEITSIGSGHISVQNSQIILDGPRGQVLRKFRMAMPEIELLGDVSIILPDEFKFGSAPILYNVSTSGDLHIHTVSNNPLFTITSELIDGNLYLKYIRETDYGKILKNNSGKFLNNLREISSGDPLITALDSAPDMDALNKIMSRSVRLNPINLMRPIRAINQYMISGMRLPDAGANISSFYLLENDFYGYGMIASGATTIDDRWNISFAGYVHAIEYSDDINDFAALSYGGRFTSDYRLNNIYSIRSVAVATFSKFRSGMVLDGDGTAYNPSGRSAYAVSDIRARLYNDNHINVGSYFGIGADWAQVLSDADLDITGRAGIEAMFNTEIDGVRYNYELRGGVGTNMDIDATAAISFKSAMDNIGGDFALSYIRYDNINAVIARIGFTINF